MLNVAIDWRLSRGWDEGKLSLLPARERPDAAIWQGLILRADSLENPQNYIAFITQPGATSAQTSKCVNGVLSQVNYNGDTGQRELIEMRAVGITIKTWLNQYPQPDLVIDEPTINRFLAT